MHQIRISSLAALQIAQDNGSLGPQNPLIGFNLGRGGVKGVTYTCKYGERVYTKRRRGKTPLGLTFYWWVVCVVSHGYKSGRLSNALDGIDPLSYVMSRIHTHHVDSLRGSTGRLIGSLCEQ